MTAPDPAAQIRTALDTAEQTAKAAGKDLVCRLNGPLSSPVSLTEMWPEQQACVERFADPAAVLRHVAAARQILDNAEAMLRRIPELDHDGDPRNPECPCIYCTGRFSATATLTALAAAWQPAQQETP